MSQKTDLDLVGVFSRAPLGREFEPFLEFAEFTRESGSRRIYKIPRSRLSAALSRGGRPIPTGMDK
jgi:hypothetical protein